MQGSTDAQIPVIKEVVDLSIELYDGMPNIIKNPVSFGTLYTHDWIAEITQGAFAMEAREIIMPEHCGTHFDCPYHFDPNGLAVNEFPLEKCVLPANFYDFSSKKPLEAITIADFEEAEKKTGRKVEAGKAIVAWTGGDKVWGQPGFDRERPFVPTDTAQWLVDRGMTLFATDMVGMDDPAQWWWPTHDIWLKAGVPMVQQCCNLDKLVGKEFLFVALPLKIRKGSGSPVRAVALVF